MNEQEPRDAALWFCECGHGWGWHHDFDFEAEREMGHACDHWTGCRCKWWSKPALEGR